MKSNTMKLRLFTLPLLALSFALPAATAEAQPLWMPYHALANLHPVEMQKLVEQFKKLCPSQGWTVTTKNNDILIRCEKPLSVFTIPLGTRTATDAKPIKVREVYQFTLRVSPLVTTAQYDQLLAENLATQQKNRALLNKYGFDESLESGTISETDQQSDHYLSYAAAARKLAYLRLPTLYSKDYSFVLEKASSWYRSTKPADAEVKEQSRAVEAAILKNFGTYLPPNAKGANPFGVNGQNPFGIAESALPFQGTYLPWELEIEPATVSR